MQKLNTTLVYILSVVGFLCCCIYGLGTVAAIIAIVIANKELKKYHENPDGYTNGKAMKTAKTVATISLVLSLIGLSITVYALLNECAFNQWIYDWFMQNGASEQQLEPLRAALEDSGCM